MLVTGGAGFIGSHVVEGLLRLGHKVVVVDNLSSGRLENLAAVRDDIEFHQDDVRSLLRMQRLCKDVDFVIHEAAMNRVQRSIDDPAQTNHVNVVGTLNVLIAARDNGVKKVVYASSSSVYGDSPISPKVETMPTTPKSPYAVSKLAGENYCIAFTEAYGLPTACLRYFSIYGRRQRADIQYAAVIPKFIDLLARRQPLTIYGDGTQTRDFTYVKDAVDATLLCLDDKAIGVYNVAKGRGNSVKELAAHLESITGKMAEHTYTALPKGDCRESHADIARISAIGYAPKYSLGTGLEDILCAE